MSSVMHKFKDGDEIYTTLSTLMECSYIRNYYVNNFLAVELNDAPLMGIVLGYSGTGKVAVQFVEKIWKVGYEKCDHNNGCHGKGAVNYCMYIPEEFLIPCPVSYSPPQPPCHLSANALESPTERHNQLLLLL